MEILCYERRRYVNGFAPGPHDIARIDESVNFLGINDKIIFSTDPLDGLDGQTITFADGFDSLSITNSVTIDATALPGGLTIDANDPTPGETNGDGSRIFNIGGFSAVAVLPL